MKIIYFIVFTCFLFWSLTRPKETAKLYTTKEVDSIVTANVNMYQAQFNYLDSACYFINKKDYKIVKRFVKE